jgi:hypothetical protein
MDLVLVGGVVVVVVGDVGLLLSLHASASPKPNSETDITNSFFMFFHLLKRHEYSALTERNPHLPLLPQLSRLARSGIA